MGKKVKDKPVLNGYDNFDNLSNEQRKESENNRYDMLKYYRLLQAKLSYIIFWSDILLGNQSCHSQNYRDAEVGKGPRNLLDCNATNAYAKQFLNLKKLDKVKLKMPIKHWNKVLERS